MILPFCFCRIFYNFFNGKTIYLFIYKKEDKIMTMCEVQTKVREIGKKKGYESVRKSVDFMAEEILMGKNRTEENISKEVVTNQIALMTIYLTELAETLNITDKDICEELKKAGEQLVKVYEKED